MQSLMQVDESGQKVQLRQDSSVSSDSYSQTSSPSYTSKTMETPLLPHHKAKKKSTVSGYERSQALPWKKYFLKTI